MREILPYQRRRTLRRTVTLLVAIDIGIAAAVLACWSWLAPFVTEPLSWATSRGLPPRPALNEYPATILWMVPLGSAACAWVLYKIGHPRAGAALAFFPVWFLGLITGWFYLAPPGWR
jgi:hypothetical protein